MNTHTRQIIQALRKQVAERDATIADLNQQLADWEDRLSRVEQDSNESVHQAQYQSTLAKRALEKSNQRFQEDLCTERYMMKRDADEAVRRMWLRGPRYC